MSAAEKITEFRKSKQIDLYRLGRICGVGGPVLAILEDGGVTHPNIVKKVQSFFKLTDEEAELILPKNRRPHDPEYDPDKFVDPRDIYNRERIPTKIPEYDIEYASYVHDQQYRNKWGEK